MQYRDEDRKFSQSHHFDLQRVRYDLQLTGIIYELSCGIPILVLPLPWTLSPAFLPSYNFCRCGPTD